MSADAARRTSWEIKDAAGRIVYPAPPGPAIRPVRSQERKVEDRDGA